MALFRLFFLLLLLLPLLGQAQRPALPPSMGRPATAPTPPQPAPVQVQPARRIPAGPRPAITITPQGKGSPIRLLPGTGVLEGSISNGLKIRKLLGNVSFQQDDVFLYCD